MKFALRILFTAAMVPVLGFTGLFAKPLMVGSPAPDFTLTDINGTSRSLSDFRGKTVVIEWTNPECPVVGKHYDRSGNIPKLQQKAIAEGVVWLAINSAKSGGQGDFEPAEVQAWLKKNNAAPTAYMRDSTRVVGKLYDARTTPHMFVVDAKGTLVYNGAIDSISSGNPNDIAKAENYVAAALIAVKNGVAPAHPTSKPYGCGIKY